MLCLIWLLYICRSRVVCILVISEPVISRTYNAVSLIFYATTHLYPTWSTQFPVVNTRNKNASKSALGGSNSTRQSKSQIVPDRSYTSNSLRPSDMGASETLYIIHRFRQWFIISGEPSHCLLHCCFIINKTWFLLNNIQWNFHRQAFSFRQKL